VATAAYGAPSRPGPKPPAKAATISAARTGRVGQGTTMHQRYRRGSPSRAADRRGGTTPVHALDTFEDWSPEHPQTPGPNSDGIVGISGAYLQMSLGPRLTRGARCLP
jgi:hypothetical protein